MKLATVLSGQTFIFRSLKEVLAKANELKSGDVLAGVAASSDLERIAAKEVLSQLLLSDLRNHPVVPYEEDEVTRINQDGIDETVYQRIKNWTVAELREYILSHETTEDDIHLLSKGLTSEMVAAVCKLMTNMDLVYGASKVRVPAHCNTTIGLRGTLATRLQPNHYGIFAVGSVLCYGAFNPAVAMGLGMLNVACWQSVFVTIITNLVAGAAAACVYKYVAPDKIEIEL